MRGSLAQPVDDVEATHVGQPEVEEDEVGPESLGGLEAALPGVCHLHPKAMALKVVGDGAADRRIVLDDQHPRAVVHEGSSASGRGGDGMLKAKRAPPSGRFSAQIRPPWASTRPRATARPRPLPRTASAPGAR